VDIRSLSLGERIAAASGAAFFVLTFAPWLEASDQAGGDPQSAWELFSIVDVLLALLALAAVALPLAKAAGADVPIRPSNKAILTRIGIIILAVILAFLLEGDKAWGIWLALLAAVALLYGATTMPDEETSSRRRDRSRRPRAAEDFEEPPPGMRSWREGAPYGDEGEGGAGEEESAAPPAGRPGERARDPRAGAGPPPRGAEQEEPPRREPIFGPDDLSEEPDAGRTEVRGPRRPPEVPPSTGR
jgi:hypothetical protein